jgi:hypothetical protein
MPILFANTGVQLLCVPLPPGGRLPADATGAGWQHYEAEDGPRRELKSYAYLQWQIRTARAGKLFLAVDTTCGRPQDGYLCDLGTLDKDLTIPLDLTRLLGRNGRPLGIKRFVELVVRPLGAGDPKAVDMVVDLGNSRTGALLLEPSGDKLANPPLPFGLINRHRLDAWDEAGRFDQGGPERWFSSRTHWCTPPYRDPAPVSRIKTQAVKGWFGAEAKARRWEESVIPELFRDLSMARMGQEADDVTLAMDLGGDLRTGLSSPKRYLWADDDSWLEGADWFMADPDNRFGTGNSAARLQGKLLRYLPEDDRDDLVTQDPPPPGPLASEAPIKPRHAPRVVMVAALYELLCQAYTAINSTAYRDSAGDPARPRVLRSLTLTYPSGMVAEERKRLELQARKAARIFHLTLGRDQPDEPHITLEIDEASAVHITYLWSELQMTGLDPDLWFALVGRGGDEAAPPLTETPASEETGRRDVRIACIDIGGGTTDFMIARYTFTRGIPSSIRGEVLERDGVPVAGDQLVKRLLETVIVPSFAAAVGLEPNLVKLLFGPQVPHNLQLRPERIRWMNRLLVPLARRYLDHAVADDRQTPVSHTDPDVVAVEVLEELEATLERITGRGGSSALREPMGLVYRRDDLDRVVAEVFRDMLFDFGRRIVARGCDVVLLAGQPTKLGAIQRLVHLFLPLAPSRVIPMYKHYAGHWYPYQDPQGRDPGVIVDPKSAVVVGAAIHFLAKYGMLGSVKFEIRDPARRNAYYWGAINDVTSRIVHPMFEPTVPASVFEFRTSQRQVLIGRRLSAAASAHASPVYLLKLDPEGRLGDIDAKVRLRRLLPDAHRDEEALELDSVSGTIAGEEAVAGHNVTLRLRTLAEARYYLDTGGLDNIQLDAR